MAAWFLGLALASCQPGPSTEGTPTSSTDATVSYQPNYAENFWIQNTDGGKLLYLTPFQDSPDTLVFGLYPSSQPQPQLPEKITPISTPIESVVALSATHVGMLGAIGQTQTIVGLSHPEYIYHPQVRERLQSGEVEDVGVEGGLNREQLLVMQPNLIMASVMSAAGHAKDFGALQKAGIAVLPNAEWTEPSVLGRAEWMVAIAALYGQQEQAERRFSQIDSAYQSLAELEIGRAHV